MSRTPDSSDNPLAPELATGVWLFEVIGWRAPSVLVVVGEYWSDIDVEKTAGKRTSMRPQITPSDSRKTIRLVVVNFQSLPSFFADSFLVISKAHVANNPIC